MPKSKEQKRVEARWRDLRIRVPYEKAALASMGIDGTEGYKQIVALKKQQLDQLEKELAQVEHRIKQGFKKKKYVPGSLPQ